MRRWLYHIVAFFALCAAKANAQDIVNNTDDVFFNANYCPATLYSAEKHIYRGLKIKLDLRSQQVLFVKENSDEVELTVSFTVRKIEFGACGNGKSNAVFQSGFPPVASQDKNFLYQVLDSGNTRLLKSIKVVQKQDKKYEYGGKEPTYEKWEAYYLYNPSGGMIKVARSKEALLKALDDKKDAVEEFITANNIRFRNDEDMAKVVAFYNSK